MVQHFGYDAAFLTAAVAAAAAVALFALAMPETAPDRQSPAPPRLALSPD